MNKTGESETGERIISFERAETNHDKVALPKQQSNETSIYIVSLHNLHKLSSCVFCGQLPRICDPCGKSTPVGRFPFDQIFRFEIPGIFHATNGTVFSGSLD